ncbi:hypothetical protein TSAR_016047 [Trichomalopsis sarcophagae]|uniref:Uncharacterized protein n=1 Tax=Trichomalopsis sarcophagae TaxID=543379 RepID=A0A232EQ43_9HYME|nr:hypothetical protein TSAR_016047 [Trichomalopsis sarcophagae]
MSLNTNSEATLLEVPGAQGWQYQRRSPGVLRKIMTYFVETHWDWGFSRYLVSRVDSINIASWDYLKYSTISKLSGPRNPRKMTLILFTLDTRYLKEL